MKTVNMHEAKTQFSRLIAAIEKGEEIIIARAGKPVARIVRVGVGASRAKGHDPVVRRTGGLRGKAWTSKDFDEPLPDDILDAFASDDKNLKR